MAVWERRWIQERLSEEERSRDLERRSSPFRQISLYSVEYDLVTGKEIHNVTVEGVYEALVESTYFIPNSTELLLFEGHRANRDLRRDIVAFQYVTSGNKRVVQISGISNILPITLGNFPSYIAWRATRDGKKFYFIQQKTLDFRLKVMDRQGIWKDCYVQKGEGKLSKARYAWSYLALSPDDRFAALVGLQEAVRQYGYGVATVRIVNLETGNSYLVVRRIATKNLAWQIEWLDTDTVAVSTETQEGEFFFVDVKEQD
ncbi:MAG: hypothetical protein LBQ42_01150 [Synergistaceae bacterium]|nr:hypothetical protein [Synergistaceae bacterium]